MPPAAALSAGPRARPRRQVHLPPVRACSRRSPTAARSSSGYAPGADCASTLACLRRARRRRPAQAPQPRHPRDRRAIDGRGLRGLHGARPARSTPATPARRCGCCPAFWPRTRSPPTLTGDDSLRARPMRRVIEPLTAMGARIDADDGPRAADHHGRRAARRIDYAPASAERPGEERRPAGRAAGRGRDRRSASRSRRAIIRSGRSARSVPRSAHRAAGLSPSTAASGCARSTATVPGDVSSCDVLGGRRRGAARRRTSRSRTSA